MPDSHIASALGSESRGSLPVVGGCIHDCRHLRLTDGRSVFVKLARGEKVPLLLAEAAGLARLAPHIRVPEVLAQGETPDGTRWLAMEWLVLREKDHESWADLGRQLAALHAVTRERHGLSRESYVGSTRSPYRWSDAANFIGLTPQDNTPASSWQEFYIERRLRPQIRLAHANGHAVPELEILTRAECLLAGHEPRPALLHGDLWHGNVAALPDSKSVVFDPAPYHGDPETDLAMLELFGGGQVPAAFHSAYGPRPPGYFRRRPLYDLYHLLNHLNLFGDSYARRVADCVKGLGA